MHGDGGEIGKLTPLPSCPYRRPAGATPGTPAHYVCDCAGGIPIGLDDQDPRLAEICESCNIPAGIDPNRRSCLFLIPVRIWENDSLRSGFSCRWFHNLNPKKLPREAWLCCLGCPHWFPRPPGEGSIPRMTDWIHKVIRLYWVPEISSPPPHSVVPAAAGKSTPSSSPLREAISERVRRFTKVVRLRRAGWSSPITQGES